MRLLDKLSLSLTLPSLQGCFTDADSGAIDTMLPNKLSFISLKKVFELNVWMGNNSYIPVLGQGSTIVTLNSECILIRNALHSPGLTVPLFSLHAHMMQHGFGFFGSNKLGFLVYFPMFVLLVDTSVDCHLSYKPLGTSAQLNTLHYLKPRCPPTLYPSKFLPSLSTATPSLPSPALIKDDEDTVLPVVDPALSDPSAPPSAMDLGLLSSQLQLLVDPVGKLSSSPSGLLSPTSSNEPPSENNAAPASCLLSTMTSNEFARLLHHPGTSFPSIFPCNTANALDTKTHWSAEELHRVMSCCKFHNYSHFLVSPDGEWVEGGEIPWSLGTYATIPKAKQGGTLDRAKY